MNQKFDIKRLPRGSAIAGNLPPPVPRRDGTGMTPWVPLTPKLKEYLNGCSFINTAMRGSITHSRFGYCQNLSLLLCFGIHHFFFFFFFKNFLGQFELSTKLQFPSKLVELKWWCSTTLGTPFFFFFFLKNFFLGKPFHEQARYISDIEEIDMAAIIELMGLDVSRMDQQPPKGIFYILFF